MSRFILNSRNLGLLRHLPSSRLLTRQILTRMKHVRFYSAPKESKTKSQLLAQSSSALSRMWVHIKWPLTRNDRPFSIDDFSAFASWLVMGNVLWIILGTTTFGLVTMYSVHTFDNVWKTIKGDDDDEKRVQKDDSFLGYLTGAILSQGLGVKFVFEKGNILPQLTDGMLKFKNLQVLSLDSPETEEQNLNFSASIQELNLTLSFKKWYEGSGLIYNLEVLGMHAKVYKNDTRPIPDSDIAQKKAVIPFSSLALSFSRFNDANTMNDLNEHNYEELQSVKPKKLSLIDSDYDFANVKVHDSFIELYENHEEKPFKITIFNCDLPRLRGNRLLIDFFNANNVTGAVNNSMFTIHKHQSFVDEDNVVRFKLDGIDMESLSRANPQLKFNWIVNGKAEVVADIRLPALDGTKPEAPVPMGGFFQQILNELMAVTSAPKESSEENEAGNNNLIKGAITALYETFTTRKEVEEPLQNESEYVIVNVKVKFFDLKATLPLHLPMASSAPVPFVTLQNLRSLIAFINDSEARSPLVIKTTVIEKLSDLYHLENLSQTRVFDAIVSDIYDDLMRMIKLDEKRIIEEKSNLWSHSVASQLLLLGLGVLA